MSLGGTAGAAHRARRIGYVPMSHSPTYGGAQRRLAHGVSLNFRVIQLHAEAGAVGGNGAAGSEGEGFAEDIVFVVEGADDVAGIEVGRDPAVGAREMEHRGGADAELQVRPDGAGDALRDGEVSDCLRRADAAGFADVDREHIAGFGADESPR